MLEDQRVLSCHGSTGGMKSYGLWFIWEEYKPVVIELHAFQLKPHTQCDLI